MSVVLFDRQIVRLDQLSTNIRARSGSCVNRTEIIRALIDAVTDSGLNLTTAVSQQDLAARLRHRLAR